jgi:hypothetical protein
MIITTVLSVYPKSDGSHGSANCSKSGPWTKIARTMDEKGMRQALLEIDRRPKVGERFIVAQVNEQGGSAMALTFEAVGSKEQLVVV